MLPFELGVPPTALNTNGFVGVLEDNFLSGDRRAKCEALSSCSACEWRWHFADGAGTLWHRPCDFAC